MTKYAIVINGIVEAFVEAADEDVQKSRTLKKVSDDIQLKDKVDNEGKKTPSEQNSTLTVAKRIEYLKQTDWTQIPNNLLKKEADLWADWRDKIRAGVLDTPPGDLTNYGITE